MFPQSPPQGDHESGSEDSKPIFNMTNQEFGWHHLVFVRAADIIVRNSEERNAEAIAKMIADGSRDEIVADFQRTEEALFALWQLVQMAREIVEANSA